MPSNIDLVAVLDLLDSSALETLKLGIIVYIGLLWLFIIIWVLRDSINRSEGMLFPVFAVILNIAIPILGVLLYLIIRPSKTRIERYYEELEHELILENLPKSKKSKKKSSK